MTPYIAIAIYLSLIAWVIVDTIRDGDDLNGAV